MTHGKRQREVVATLIRSLKHSFSIILVSDNHDEMKKRETCCLEMLGRQLQAAAVTRMEPCRGLDLVIKEDDIRDPSDQ